MYIAHVNSIIYDEVSLISLCEINFNNSQLPLFIYGKFVSKIDHDKWSQWL